MPPSTRARASASAAAMTRSMEPSQRGLPGSGGTWTMPIRRIDEKSSTRQRLDSPLETRL